MTMDKSLKVRRGMIRSRSVLTRAERIDRLKASARWPDGATAPYGLPKVRVYKLSMKKKNKKKEEEEGAAGAAAPAAGAKPAAAAKPAAKGAKK